MNQKIIQTYQRGAARVKAMTGKQPTVPQAAELPPEPERTLCGGYVDTAVAARKRGEAILFEADQLRQQQEMEASKARVRKLFPPARLIP
jgi:hypothetical protein